MKKLINDQQELINFLLDSFDDESEVERLLGIEFSLENGMYWSDISSDPNLTEKIEDEYLKLDTDTTTFKEYDAYLPKEYPCIIIFENSKDFDRVGSFEIEYLEYVYLSDFEDQ